MSSDLHLHYAATGSGPAVCLIHAFPMDHTMWNLEVQTLSKRNTVWAPDLPGFGQSPPHPGWRLRDVAASIIETADANGVSEFGIVGLSMGTYTAFEIHRQAPERVRFMVLASGRARGDSETERAGRTELIAAVRKRGLVALGDVMLPRLLGPNARRGLTERVQQAIDAATIDGVAGALEALRERRDSTSLLRHIQCRTLVIAGETDTITPPAECRTMAEAIPNGEFLEIGGAGHLSNLERPDDFNAALGAFLGSLE